MDKTAVVGDKKAAGIGELMVDVRNTYADLLTESQLFSWHIMLLNTNTTRKVGEWYDHGEPMQVVSGDKFYSYPGFTGSAGEGCYY